MSFLYRFSDERSLVTIKAHDPVNVSTCEGIIDYIASNPKLFSPYRILIDFRAVTFRPSASEIRELALCLGHNRDNLDHRVALLVSGEFAYGLARMVANYAAVAGFECLQVFDTLAKATTWIETNRLQELIYEP